MTIRYATIGTSWITREFIGGAALAGGLQLAAVYSRNEESGAAFAAGLGGVPVYTDLEKLAASGIDAVYIASPNSLHYPQSRFFLERGIHVLCENRRRSTQRSCSICKTLPRPKNWSASRR